MYLITLPRSLESNKLNHLSPDAFRGLDLAEM